MVRLILDRYLVRRYRRAAQAVPRDRVIAVLRRLRDGKDLPCVIAPLEAYRRQVLDTINPLPSISGKGGQRSGMSDREIVFWTGVAHGMELAGGLIEEWADMKEGNETNGPA